MSGRTISAGECGQVQHIAQQYYSMIIVLELSRNSAGIDVLP
jgi:hypothetical protein